MKKNPITRLGLLALAAFTGIVLADGIESLPQTADGTPSLPPVSVNVSTVGSYFWSRLQGQTPQQHIYGEVGEAIDSALSNAGIDIQNESGTFYFYVTFVYMDSIINVDDLVDKEAGESLEETFEREFAEGDLEPIALATPAIDSGDEGFGDNGLDDPSDPFAPPSDSLVFPPNSVIVIGGSSGLWCGPGTEYICIY